MATTAQLLDLDGFGQRQATFRWDLLDASLAYQDNLEPTTGATISLDTSQAIMRTTRITLPFGDDLGFDVAQARVRPNLVLENGYVKALGTFLFTARSIERSSVGAVFTGTLEDLGFLVDQRSTYSYGVPAGALVDSYIEAILVQQGITYYDIDATGQSVGTSIGWPPNTSWLTIVNELAALAGCLPLYFESDGRARIRATPQPEVDPIDVTYSSGRNIFDTGIGEQDNALSAPNLFVVVETGANTAGIRGEYSVPASAPNSEFQRGVQIPYVTTEQGLLSVAAANERARRLALTDGAVVEGRTFDGPPDPRHEPFALVEFMGERYLERSWQLVCTEGANHSHSLSRVYS